MDDESIEVKVARLEERLTQTEEDVKKLQEHEDRRTLWMMRAFLTSTLSFLGFIVTLVMVIAKSS